MFDQYLGSWTGVSRLYLEGASGPHHASDSTLVASVTVRKFLEVRYTWSHEGKPCEGLILFSADGASWVDSWHQGKQILQLKGEPLNVLGSYKVGDHPEWGWRIRLDRDGEALKLTMFNISPEGEEYLAVAGEYQRA
jgi:hypothetical protein